MFKKAEKHITDKDALKTLPRNRKEVFFDLLRHRKMNLFALSSFTFMFFIPLAIDLLYFNFLENVAIANDKLDYLFSLIFYSMLIMLPCMIIGFIGLSGAFQVVKKMVWQEGIVLASEFFQGVKENWKHAFINGVIFGATLFGLVVGSSYLMIFSREMPVLCGVGIGALVVIFLFFGMSIAIFYTQDVYYENSYLTTLKNSFRFLALLNWKVLVIFLLSTGAVIALAALNLITLVIGLFLFAVLNSVVIVLYTLVAHDAFDKYINMDNYPDMVGKGLYKDENIDLDINGEV